MLGDFFSFWQEAPEHPIFCLYALLQLYENTHTNCKRNVEQQGWLAWPGLGSFDP